MTMVNVENFSVYKIVKNILGLTMLVIIMSGCAGTLPKPETSNSSLIILSIGASRALGTNRPDVVVIVRKEDGKNIKHTLNTGEYYYFANLAEGTYQIAAAAIHIKGGTTSSQSGVVTTTFSTSVSSIFPFDKKIVKTSTIKLKAGKVGFMGNITAQGASKLFPPGAIKISNVKISKTEEDKYIAEEYMRKKYKNSSWCDRL